MKSENIFKARDSNGIARVDTNISPDFILSHDESLSFLDAIRVEQVW